MLEKFLWIFKCITMTNDKDVEEKGSNGRDRGRRRREEGRGGERKGRKWWVRGGDEEESENKMKG